MPSPSPTRARSGLPAPAPWALLRAGLGGMAELDIPLVGWVLSPELPGIAEPIADTDIRKPRGHGAESQPGGVAAMRILVVEDEKRIAQLIRKGLREEGFVVDVLHRGDEAFDTLQTTPFDAVVLDVMLPGRDGLSILRRLREKANRTPVLMLTARGELSERVEGLNAGADDYLAKPFSVQEVAARLRALIRRTSGEAFSLYRVGDLVLDLPNRTVLRGARKIALTSREFSLLECLMRSPGRVLSRIQICEHVWDYQFDPGTNLVDVYIQRLRRKVDDDEDVKLIQTVRGTGYRIGEAA